ncbi:sugar ABC transporter ATP-binding protein [Propionibacterium freudenreichii]|uniref:sugar ABC transporter ATP-binding protein n=1 Tax=Propionibacterium freudenreichii TaxID=1744 RepID=UPI0005443D2A|nr:sugar ABC transporter ATP-binding protein [Propionibacterium freudenreichii]MCT3018768.1 sugar ABC transporter ATP-binding protein [Propionibacterium freudenreichii]MDK9640826.1 sugar ABC transporter ATP-binding protein [Propionibacterium freudenreichii]WBF62718.1 sugar ABC transporter ATP-binding protein [Propionibacterium freudenreichii]CEG89300.1 ATP binding protein of ABC transporter, ATPase component [Propionibacterium freudenreichii]CEH04263.1 ATP binding protein of ABC transporter, A
MTEPTARIVEMRGISIEFPGVKALQDVDLTLYQGEVHALMGENGAGKSTLIKALTGVYSIDSGSITIAGRKRTLNGTADAQRAGVATVYQEVNLCTNLTIGENLMLGHEAHGPLGINWKKTYQLAKQALARFGLDHLDPRAPLSDLSIAMQQLVAVSRAMVIDAKVLILDEPTSSLDAHEVETLFSVMRRLRDQGVAILFVSHFLDQVYEISDRMTILRNGQFIGSYRTRELDRTTLISKMIGKDYSSLSTIAREADEVAGTEARTPFIKVLGLGRKGSIEAVDLDLFAGEIIGFAGPLGSGRTELARLLYGADKPESGQIAIDGKDVSIGSPATALKDRIAYSTENRRDEGIIADLTVRENIILALQARRGWIRPIPRREQDAIAKKYIEALNVRPPDPEKLIKNLSGGNQQKVLLARWLATEPRLLILDEPTRGIDVGAKSEIQEAVVKLANEGMSVIFISSELEEVVRLSQRILVLKDNRAIATIANGPDVSANTIVDIIAKEGQAA